MTSIQKSRRVMRKAFKKDFDYKRTYIDNIACILMDHLEPLRYNKEQRDIISEEIIDRIFGE